MPRSTCGPSDHLGRTNPTDEDNNIKREFGLTAVEQVSHRKSERRRVARDIFFVLETQPNRRNKGTKGKQNRPKQKFGHLKVANQNRKSKCLLRDIKNEPKCVQAANIEKQQPNGNIINNNNNNISNNTNKKTATTVKIETKIASNAATTTRTVAIPTAINDTNNDNKRTDSPPLTPSVNPIFVWVKQDDTRIVEVRCEDYDKRNRIRLTKTNNGWRAIPRTDSSSTRIVKFFQNATPLMKVKREVYENQQELQQEKQTQLEELCAQKEREAEELRQLTHIEPIVEPHVDNIIRTCKKEIIVNDCATSSFSDYPQSEDDTEPVTNETTFEQPTEACAHNACFDVLLKNATATDALNKTQQITPTYQKESPTETATSASAKSVELQLCPKTGLFLPKHLVESDVLDNNKTRVTLLNKDPIENIELSATKKPTNLPRTASIESSTDTFESFETNAKNLKDLLDDADLFQHCSSDNGNSGADLLDSLVKRSCEDTDLIQETSTVEADELKDNLVLNPFCVTELKDLNTKDLTGTLPQIIDMVNEAPKCLSFNEAGEIEGLNGDLFQPTNFIDTFEKEPSISIEAEEDNEEKSDDAPKDLSYKKREEVCPPSESRSQCAVTSSSDIIKSPVHEMCGNIPNEVETTSETIKNLILEQFIKLNALNQMPVIPGVINQQQQQQQQAEPIDLGKHREKNLETATAPTTTTTSATTNYVETVVIDEDDEEPLKKRLCNAVKNNIKLDKDPDPLTQLQLLIRNSQWKVPDPILVPKDRLSAVLASPAREIPLLLTTRPELRLPEAFAYPEIIQNPNILVISMAQLEAILKNEMVVEQSKPVDDVVELSSNKLNTNETHKQSQKQQQQQMLHQTKEMPNNNNNCPHLQQTDSHLASDINAATLAVLNQMLWLPYFGQLSQEFFKSLKDPLGIQRKLNSNSNMSPFYNNHTSNQFGLQHLDELYKHYVKHINTPKHSVQTQPVEELPKVPHSPNYNSFPNPVELALLQKLLQPQMTNILGMNAAAAAAAAAAAETVTQCVQSPTMKHASNEHQHLEQKRSRRCMNESNSLETLNIPDFNSNLSLIDKSHCLSDNSSINKANFEKKVPQTQPQPKPVTETKPRLTCKSLSNLLEPDLNNPVSAVPLLNVPFDNLRRTQSKPIPGRDTQLSDSNHSNMRTLRSSANKANSSQQYNVLEHCKQRKRNINLQDTAATTTVDPTTKNVDGSANVDTNAALWHPLFGSNTKQGYNSPWQWTTVTATGE